MNGTKGNFSSKLNMAAVLGLAAGAMMGFTGGAPRPTPIGLRGGFTDRDEMEKSMLAQAEAESKREKRRARNLRNAQKAAGSNGS